jgi:hypothetical protein
MCFSIFPTQPAHVVRSNSTISSQRPSSWTVARVRGFAPLVQLREQLRTLPLGSLGRVATGGDGPAEVVRPMCVVSGRPAIPRIVRILRRRSSVDHVLWQPASAHVDGRDIRPGSTNVDMTLT